MGRFMARLIQAGTHAAMGAAVGAVGVVVYQMAFTGGALSHRFSLDAAAKGAAVGLILGALLGFSRR